MELPFGSVSPIWQGGLAPWLPASASAMMLNRPPGGGLMQQQVAQPPGSAAAALPFSQPLNIPTTEPYGVGFGAPLSPLALAATYPPVTVPFGPPNITALLMAIAMRRGQPAGPTNDQDIEDFVYDVFELLPATNEVEVRCESGRVTLTGSVQHKRLKHDVGEIVWAIPAVNDVQNNVTIATKRRARAGSREQEQQSAAVARKQA
jgi:BON domain